jgi:AbrB family looped-hinge helix DNA binding protein
VFKISLRDLLVLTDILSSTILISMNSTYSITSKFQVTIPKEAREKLGIVSNDSVKFTTQGNKLVMERVQTMEEVAHALAADLKSKGVKPATDEDIKNARQAFYQKGLQWD